MIKYLVLALFIASCITPKQKSTGIPIKLSDISKPADTVGPQSK